MGRLNQAGDRTRWWFPNRHRVPEVGVRVDRRRDDDPPDRAFPSATPFCTTRADLDHATVTQANVGRPRALDVQDGTYDEHAVLGGNLSPP